MADTSKATIAAVVERLHEREQTTRDYVANSQSVVTAFADQLERFEARDPERPHNVYAVRLAVDHQSSLRTDTKIADEYAEAASLISALEAERDTLKQINANLMGDDENVPRYTTRRLKQEIARHMEAAEALNATLQAKLEKAAEAMRRIMPYLKYTIGDESPGYHPTMPSAVAAFQDTLSTLREAEAAAIRKGGEHA